MTQPLSRRFAAVLGLGLLFLLPQCSAPRSETLPDGMLLHEVFFQLSDPTPENIAALIAGCETLREIPTVASLAAGARNPDLTRDVNQTDFHVGLHVSFASSADHDTYQEHDVHLAFIEKYSAGWAGVRVFDFTAGVASAQPEPEAAESAESDS